MESEVAMPLFLSIRAAARVGLVLECSDKTKNLPAGFVLFENGNEWPDDDSQPEFAFLMFDTLAEIDAVLEAFSGDQGVLPVRVDNTISLKWTDD
jgi:hypothetical protein